MTLRKPQTPRNFQVQRRPAPEEGRQVADYFLCQTLWSEEWRQQRDVRPNT